MARLLGKVIAPPMNKYYVLLTQNAALCTFFGALIGAGFMWFITSPLSDNLIRYGTYGISVLAALIASGIAWMSAMANIHNQQNLAKTAGEQSLLAARAVLPPVLSSLHNKAQLGFVASANQIKLKANSDEALKSLEQLALTPDELSALQKCIQFSDEDTARWLSLIISHFQIHHARLEGNLFTVGLIKLEKQIANDALDWSLTSTMVLHLIEFARTGKVPTLDLPKENIVIPIHFDGTGPVMTHWDNVFRRVCHHFDDTGGWSSIAFQKRLLNPNN
jgi:hypothetical protein